MNLLWEQYINSDILNIACHVITGRNLTHEIWGSHSGPGDDSSLQGYDVTFMTHWRRPVIFIQGAEINKKSSSNLIILGARRVT